MNFVYVRDKSDDRSIWTSVVNDDEYRIDALAPEDIVLDIGMHTGSFCARAYLAGARRIYGFEVDSDNFRLAQMNVGTFASLYNVAVVRSDDGAEDPLYYTGHIPMEHELNTGVGTVFGDEGDPVPTAPLDTVLAQMGEVRLVKLDTEGSEWPILYTSQRLSQVVEFVGEWHLNHEGLAERFDLPPCTLAELCEHFAQNGFTARCYARDEDMPTPVVGYFRAMRRDVLAEDDPWRIGEARTLVCASVF